MAGAGVYGAGSVYRITPDVPPVVSASDSDAGGLSVPGIGSPGGLGGLQGGSGVGFGSGSGDAGIPWWVWAVGVVVVVVAVAPKR